MKQLVISEDEDSQEVKASLEELLPSLKDIATKTKKSSSISES